MSLLRSILPSEALLYILCLCFFPQVGQEIEVRPGIVSKTQDGKIQCIPIYSRIVSLFTEMNELQYAVPGGLIGEPFESVGSLDLRAHSRFH